MISSAYRGQRLGKLLMEYVMDQAKQLAPIKLHLTSNPKRVAANKLYQSLGFQRKKTNCYTLSISGLPLDYVDTAALKQNIIYLIGNERAVGNLEPITPEYISRSLNVPREQVETCLKEMGI